MCVDTFLTASCISRKLHLRTLSRRSDRVHACEPVDASVSPPPTSESPAPCAAMADEKEPESEGGWGIAETVGWLLVGEPEADVAPPPKHQIVQANRAIGALPRARRPQAR